MPLPCAAVGGCANPAAVVWTRRPTDSELDAIVAVEEAQREEIVELADPNLPPPGFGPMPTEETTTIPVYACAAHAISIDLAARIHQNTCTAPNPPDLPGCDCTPEPLPDNPDPTVVQQMTLPDHWQPAPS